jgi:hypothetical protein
MSKFTLIGILSCLGGLLLIGFQAISALVKTNDVWNRISLVDVIGPSSFEGARSIAFLKIGHGVDYVTHMPLFLLLLIFGGICFIISMVSGR